MSERKPKFTYEQIIRRFNAVRWHDTLSRINRQNNDAIRQSSCSRCGAEAGELCGVGDTDRVAAYMHVGRARAWAMNVAKGHYKWPWMQSGPEPKV